MFQPAYSKKWNVWRIMITINDETVDVCGAASEDVARQQCVILNRMHNLPFDRTNYWKRDT